MVRTKLLVIAIFFTALFVPGFANGNPTANDVLPAITIPEGWQYKYTDNTVNTRIVILPDSTAFLDEILDAKKELFNLVDNQIRLMRFSPAYQDSIPIESSREQIFALKFSGKGVAKVFSVEKSSILNWIDDEFYAQDPFRPHQDNMEYSAPGQYTDTYRHGFYYASRYNPLQNIYHHGFGKPAFVLGNAPYLGYYRSFYRYQSDRDGYSFQSADYPFAVPLVDIQAGIGDYEFKFARGSLKKNHLFDMENLYYAFDFLVQSGDWTQVLADQTSTRHRLKIPWQDYGLEMEYENYNQVLSMTQLKPIYWIPLNYKADHSLRKISVIGTTPYFDIAFRNTKESLSSDAFHQNINSNTDQLMLSGDFSYQTSSPQYRGDLHYALEKRFYDADYQDPEEPVTERMWLQWNQKAQSMQIDTSVSYENFENIKADLSLQYMAHRLKPGFIGMWQNNIAGSYSQTPSIYAASDTLRAISGGVKHSLALFADYAVDDKVDLRFSMGTKQMQNNIPIMGFADWANVSYERDILFSELHGRYSHRLWNTQVQWIQSLVWNSYDDYIRELSQWSSSTYMNVTLPLEHDNAIFGGLGFLAHSSYLSQSDPLAVIDSSYILDLWAGVRITRLFEFNVSLKNALDSNVFGMYPMPQSLHAGLRWFYLN